MAITATRSLSLFVNTIIFFFLISSEAFHHYPRFPGKLARSPKSLRTKPYKYETRYFDQRLDHFSFSDLPNYRQRYLINTDYWPGLNRMGPIFFYCGNEGDIEWFAANTGFVWEIAPRFGAMVIFAEHRYYGESMPYGSREEAYKNAASLSYLTAEQALADYAVLLTVLKQHMSAEACPVVLFGGSYGGMLAAWMRLKYPHVAVGALASSAPILQFEDIVPPETFYDIVSSDFRRESANCLNTIKESWDVLRSEGLKGDGLLQLTKTFRLCRELKRIDDLLNWLDSAYSFLAMVNYPYPSDFLMPLPGNPIKEANLHQNASKACGIFYGAPHLGLDYLGVNLFTPCQPSLLKRNSICYMTSENQTEVCKKIDNCPSESSISECIFEGVSVYYNYSGTVDCFELDDDPHGMDGWNWQACTEMVMPLSSSQETSMFPAYDFNLSSFQDECWEDFQVKPRPSWITTEFGGHDFTSYLKKFGSNIIFSNGLLDPWSGGSVLQNVSDTIVALVTDLGAHHIDLRAATGNDPDWLVEQRASEIELIEGWIKEHYEEKTAVSSM